MHVVIVAVNSLFLLAFQFFVKKNYENTLNVYLLNDKYYSTSDTTDTCAFYSLTTDSNAVFSNRLLNAKKQVT